MVVSPVKTWKAAWSEVERFEADTCDMGPRSRVPVVARPLPGRIRHGARGDVVAREGARRRRALRDAGVRQPRQRAARRAARPGFCADTAGSRGTGGSAPARSTANRTARRGRGRDPVAMNNPPHTPFDRPSSRRVSARPSSGCRPGSVGAGPESASPCCPGSVGARRHRKRPGSRRGAVAATAAAPCSSPRRRAVHGQTILPRAWPDSLSSCASLALVQRQRPSDLDPKGA